MNTTNSPDQPHDAAPIIAYGLRAAVCLGLCLAAGMVVAREAQFNIMAQPLPGAIAEFSRQSGEVVTARSDILGGKWSNDVVGEMEPQQALERLIHNTGLQATAAPNGSLMLLAAAQDAPPPTDASQERRNMPLPQPTSQEASQPLEEVMVTAQRRAERLENVPMSVVALSSDTIENAAVTNIHELGRVASGVQITFGGANTQPAIRGVTTLTNGPGIENNVAIYIDGFYQPNPSFINMDLANVGTIEVLKGPQGTLYGRNATGGAILINTLAPSDEFTGKVEASYGRFDDRRISGYISGPVTEQIRYSLAGYTRDSDGYIKLLPNPLTGTGAGDAAPVRQRSARAKLELDLTERLTATVGYNYGLSDDARGHLFTPFDHVPATHPGPPLRATRLGTASYNDRNELWNLLNQGTLKLDYRTGVGTLTTYTSYTDLKARTGFDFDGTFVDRSYNVSKYTQETFQHAMDFAIDSIDRLDLIVGGLYYADELQYDPEFGARSYTQSPVTGERTLATVMNVDSDTEAWALYVDGTYHLTDAVSVNLGGRYSEETRDFFQSVRNAAGVYTLAPTRRDVTFSKFTPRASIRYEFAPRTSVYASWSKGFRSGTFNVAAAASPDLVIPTRPENVDAYEIGLKLAHPALRLEIAGFLYDYTDLNASLTVPNPACAGVPNCALVSSVFGNAKSAEVYGVDGQLTLAPIDGLNVRIGAAWLHARYTDFRNAVGTGLNFATGTNIPGQTQDWTGLEMARAPEFSGNVGIDYTMPLAGGSLGSLLWSTNVNYSDSYVISNPSLYCTTACPPGFEGKQRFRTNGYTLVGAQITWTDPSDYFWVGVFGKNLTDETYRVTYNGSVFGDYSAIGEPRTYGVKLGFRL